MKTVDTPIFSETTKYGSSLFYTGGLHKWGYPNSWMVYKGKFQSKTDDDWGIPIYGNSHTIKPSRKMEFHGLRVKLFMILIGFYDGN